ncbi:MAG: transcriptional regulator [Planctomycetota bacterium]|nr:MAG: transcriptional regulator [Planctomycetota bacterium]
MFADGRLEPDQERSAIRALIGRRVDGLVVIGGCLRDAELAEFAREVPLVVAGRRCREPELPCVYVDNVDGGYQAARHLIELGHRRIALIQGHHHHSDAADRHAGFRQALRDAGICEDPALICDGDFSPEAGVIAVERLVSQNAPFTAIFAMNDMMAFGARLALDRHAIAVPQRVSLVGFDDQMEAAFMTPPLTTVRQPAREMGECAAKGMIELLAGRPFTPQCMRTQLVARESTAPPD